MQSLPKKLLKFPIWQFSVITVTIGFISNAIILINFDYEMLKSTADPWFCISCTSNILPFCNRHGKAKETITPPTNLFHHNELFQLIKNLNNLTDESSNDDTNSLNVSNKYKHPEYFCNLQGNIKSKSLNIPSQCLFPIKKFRPTPFTSDRT